jgi:hypothetical protein
MLKQTCAPFYAFRKASGEKNVPGLIYILTIGVL